MRDAILLFATGVMSALGFALIAFSQKQHSQLLRAWSFKRPMAWLRPAAWTLLGLAAVTASIREGFAFGLLLWTLLLTFSALLVVGFILILRRGNSP